MDILRFISNIVASVAWPITSLIIFLILKNPLKELVASLAKLKYKDLELEFKNLEIVGKSLPKSVKSKDIPKNERVFYSSLEMQVADIATKSPESAILICWVALEVALSEAVARLSISPDSPSYRSVAHNLDCLKEYTKLDDNSFMAIQALKDLRNRVAYGSRVDIQQALTFEKIATSVIRSLQNLEKK